MKIGPAGPKRVRKKKSKKSNEEKKWKMLVMNTLYYNKLDCKNNDTEKSNSL